MHMHTSVYALSMYTVYVELYISPVCVCVQTIDINDQELSKLVDLIMNDDDLNDDGFIDYYEFVQAQRSKRASHATA